MAEFDDFPDEIRELDRMLREAAAPDAAGVARARARVRQGMTSPAPRAGWLSGAIAALGSRRLVPATAVAFGLIAAVFIAGNLVRTPTVPAPASSGSPTPQPTGSPVPISCDTAPVTPFRALVAQFDLSSGNGTGTLLYDQATQRVVSRFDAATDGQPRFVDGGAFTYIAPTGLVRQGTGPGSKPATLVAGQILSYAWSPGGKDLAYVLGISGSQTVELWLQRQGSAPVSLGPIGTAQGRETGLDDQRLIEYSSDGAYFAVVDTSVVPAAPVPGRSAGLFQVRTNTGQLIYERTPAERVPSQGAIPSDSQVVWRPGTHGLFFGNFSGVNLLDADSREVKPYHPGLRWYQPVISPDGCRIAYTTRDGDAMAPTTVIEDLQTGSTVTVPGHRSTLAFPAPGLLWLAEEQPQFSAFSGASQYEPTGVVTSRSLAGDEKALPFQYRDTNSTGFETHHDIGS
ncbi:MAG: hypothetical protein QOE92_1452 [Chloroflexota bacterium]|jgi:hypothetical protein|nr:hypothetical protein [Chloroflexota bacterium]